MWLWISATLLATAPLMGITLQLARVTELPAILLFGPAALLGPHVGAQTALRGFYYMMPVQCLLYGLVLARSELSGRRKQTLAGLLLIHAAAVVWVLLNTGTRLPA